MKFKKNHLSIKEFYERKNKILIKNRYGSLEDALIQRMMFEDLSKTGLDVYYSCPQQFIEAIENHKYLKTEPIELSKVENKKFGMIYDISSIHLKTKNKNNKSDIWAESIGVTLKSHEMHLQVDQDSMKFCKSIMQKINPKEKPIILISIETVKKEQIIEIIKYVKELGMFPITTHHHNQSIYEELGIHQFNSIDIKTWIALVNASDCVLSDDSATFYIAGGFKKPLIGIFSSTEGRVCGKYFNFILVNNKTSSIKKGIEKAVSKWNIINKEKDQQKLLEKVL